VWLDPETYKLFLNTSIYVIGATFIGLITAITLAWLVERTNMPLKILVYVGVPMTLAIPGMLQAMAWVLLLSPKIGFINTVIKTALNLNEMPFNVYSLWGMIFIEGLRLVPTAFLMLVPLLRSMDPTLEEAGAMSGAGPLATFFKVTLRVMLPGIVAVLIYQTLTALEVFEVPGILGIPAGIYVFSTKIYSILSIPEYGQANALGLIYVVIAVAATYLYSRVITRSERFSLVTGKGYRLRQIDLQQWKWVAVGIALFYLFVTVVLPFLALVYVSFLSYMQPPSAAAFASMTVKNYEEIWRNDLIGTVVWNTLKMVILTATLTVILSAVVSLVIVRSKFWGRRILDQIAFVPHAIPGIVMGLAFLWVFLQIDRLGTSLYGGVVAVSIAFSVSFMSYGTRAINAAILQIHKDLEEAARVSGANNWRTTWRVFYPLVLPTLAGTWVWAILQALRQAGMPLILYDGAENEVLSVLIWNLWDGGDIEVVGAIGVLLIVALIVAMTGIKIIGFRKSIAVQK
jgi:iron(III) transport system permease protein